MLRPVLIDLDMHVCIENKRAFFSRCFVFQQCVSCSVSAHVYHYTTEVKVIRFKAVIDFRGCIHYVCVQTCPIIDQHCRPSVSISTSGAFDLYDTDRCQWSPMATIGEKRSPRLPTEDLRMHAISDRIV